MKTICIYHSRDLDGWMSAAIVKKWFKENHKNPSFWELGNIHATDLEYDEKGNNLSFLGWDYGDDIPDLSSYDEVIMVDVAFLKEEMQKLFNQLDNRFIWIDHHKSAILDIIGIENCMTMNPDESTLYNGKRDTDFAACELTWKYLFPGKEMPEIVRLLGRYDCFGHKGTNEEQRVLEFQYGARSKMVNYEDCYTYLEDNIEDDRIGTIRTRRVVTKLYYKGLAIYEYLCAEAQQTYKKAFPIVFEEEEYVYNPNDILTHNRNFLCVNQERFNPINFGIDYHKKGYDGFACFWYKDGKWMWSLYNDNGEVDCSVIAKQYDGGGHKEAAGFVCDANTLLTIIKS